MRVLGGNEVTDAHETVAPSSATVHQGRTTGGVGDEDNSHDYHSGYGTRCEECPFTDKIWAPKTFSSGCTLMPSAAQQALFSGAAVRDFRFNEDITSVAHFEGFGILCYHRSCVRVDSGLWRRRDFCTCTD